MALDLLCLLLLFLLVQLVESNHRLVGLVLQESLVPGLHVLQLFLLGVHVLDHPISTVEVLFGLLELQQSLVILGLVVLGLRLLLLKLDLLLLQLGLEVANLFIPIHEIGLLLL